MNDPIMEREIVTRAKDYVKKHHSWECERKAYQNLVLDSGELPDAAVYVEHFNDGNVIRFGFLWVSFWKR